MDPSLDPNGTVWDLIIVGAGAAGLWAAGEAARSGPGLRIAVLDRREKIGAKILMSGGTRCNLTHVEIRPEDYRGGPARRVARVLQAHPPHLSVRRFQEELGVPVKTEPGGKLFPADDSARTVLDALRADLDRRGVSLLRGHRWFDLRPGEDGGWRLLVSRAPAHNAAAASRPSLNSRGRSEGDPEVRTQMVCRRLVLATGGCSYPQTGSDGLGWRILSRLGHSLIPPVPALCPFVLSSDHFHKTLSGVSVPAELRLRIDGRVAARSRGPLLWTHVGASGPAVLDLSGHWARARHDRPGIRLEVEATFLPGSDLADAERSWVESARLQPRRTVQRQFSDLPQSFLLVMADRTGVDPSRPLAQTPRDGRRRLLRELTGHLLPVRDTAGFGKAEVTSGGIPLDEVDDGLESTRLAGIHLAGEMLHVDGRLGGFNFQWAWSSGAVAGRTAVQRMKDSGPRLS